MRIIAGAGKGRRIPSPTRATVRPTSDKVRGAIFNILAPRIVGARVLDLFAGTGALGIEALSRGAASVVFVESDRAVGRALRASLDALGGGSARVMHADVLRAAAELAAEGERFGVILLDPPYGKGLAEATVRRVQETALLEDGGLLVAEHRRTDRMPDRCDTGEGLPLLRRSERAYGDTRLSLYGWAEV